jgi:hypothetical protein
MNQGSSRFCNELLPGPRTEALLCWLRSGCGDFSVGQRGARLCERQPAVPLPGSFHSVQGCRPALSITCLIVRDHNGQQLAYVYFENEPGRRSAAKLLTKDEVRRIAVNKNCRSYTPYLFLCSTGPMLLRYKSSTRCKSSCDACTVDLVRAQRS